MEPIEPNKIELETKRVNAHSNIEKPGNSQFEKKAEPLKETSNGAGESIDSTQLEDIAKSLNAFLNTNGTDLEIEIHKDTKTAIFKIVRKDDNKVIKEIPPKKVLDLAVKIRGLVGSLHDSNA